MSSPNGPLRVGIGGPVGAGKTTLMEMLCKAMRDRYSVAVVTNDIYTKEDALILNRMQALPEDRIVGVETGGCPHTAIREDASINLAAIAELDRTLSRPRRDLHRIRRRQPRRHLLAGARRSDDLRHRRRGGEKVPAQGRTGDHPLRPPRRQQDRSRAICRRRSRRDGSGHAGRVRGERPYVFADTLRRQGLDRIVAFIEAKAGLAGHGDGRSGRE